MNSQVSYSTIREANIHTANLVKQDIRKYRDMKTSSVKAAIFKALDKDYVVSTGILGKTKKKKKQ